MPLDLIPLHQWFDKFDKPLIIAGPCSAESEEQILSTAKEIEMNEHVQVFRAGAWKPRTRPYTFEGHGEQALKWLSEVKKQSRLLVTTEVANAEHAELALKYGIDILWIGARTTVSPFAVQEIADVLKGTDIPVLVKNPINADLALWIGALERFNGAGIKKLGAIHRGFSTAEKTKWRNVPMWTIPIELKRQFPDLPIICDPSHITGKRSLVGEVCQKSLDVGMDGLMVETHLSPNDAWSDAAQQVTPTSLKEIISNLHIRESHSEDKDFGQKLEALRRQIDSIDNEILESLKLRMDIVKEIGKEKLRNNITPLQLTRMDSLMKERELKAASLGLKEKYISELFHTIHTESVKTQTSIMNNFKDDEKSEKE